MAGLVLTLDASGEGLPEGGASLTLKADVAADTRADTLQVDGLAIEGPALSASGEVSVRGLQTNPAAEGRLAIAETNLKTLASMFAAPIATTDPDALTRASGDLTFSYADGALKLDPLSIALDDSKLDGHVHLLDPAGPVVRIKLALDQIDLDRYMPPAAGDAGQTAESSATPEATGAPADDPFAALRSLDLQAEFTIGQLKVNNARMSNLTTKVVSKDGVLKLDPMGANLYEGKFDGSVVLNASGKTPKVAAKNSLTGIQIGGLLKDVAGQDRLTGKGELHLDVQTTGLTEPEIRRSLNGTSRFAFTDGALKGVNIAQIIRQGSQALGLGGGDASTGTPGQTDFTELTGSFQMTNGVIKNQDLRAKSPLLRIEGKGTVDLPQDTIDYLIETVLVKSLEGQGGKGRDELSGLPIPVRITGPLTSPSYRPDLEAALTAKAKQQLDAKKEELQQKAEEKIQDSVGDALKGLFR
jgi:AsmA protein